jgi:hypothetical protein
MEIYAFNRLRSHEFCLKSLPTSASSLAVPLIAALDCRQLEPYSSQREQVAINEIRVHALFVQQRTRHSPKSVRRHLVT